MTDAAASPALGPDSDITESVSNVSVAPPLPTYGWYSATTTSASALCPDLLSIRNIGGADGWRGHVVRGFFRLLKVVTGL